MLVLWLTWLQRVLVLVHTIFISCSPQVIGIILQVGSLVDLQIANQTYKCLLSSHQTVTASCEQGGSGLCLGMAGNGSQLPVIGIV